MNQNSDNSKKEIIKLAARDLFFQFGFAKTSMDDIARQSGMAKPTVYYYYPGKETIFNEIVIEEATEFIDQAENEIPDDLPADEKIAAFFRLVYKRLKIYSEEMKSLPEVMCESYPHGRPIVQKINELFAEKLRPQLIQAKKEGFVDFDDVESLLSALVFMTDFLNLEWMNRVPETVRDKVVENVIQIIFNGIRRR